MGFGRYLSEKACKVEALRVKKEFGIPLTADEIREEGSFVYKILVYLLEVPCARNIFRFFLLHRAQKRCKEAGYVWNKEEKKFNQIIQYGGYQYEQSTGEESSSEGEDSSESSKTISG